MDIADVMKSVLSRKQRVKKSGNMAGQSALRPEMEDLEVRKEGTAVQFIEKASTQGRKLWVEADRLRDVGDWPGAAKLYKSAIEAGCEISAMYIQYGHALKESGKIDLAEAAYRHAVELGRGSADAHLQLGHVLKIQGKIHESELAYLQGHLIDPLEESSLTELIAMGWTPSSIAMITQSRAAATNELALHVAVVRLSAALEMFAQTTTEKLETMSSVLQEMNWSIADQRAMPAARGSVSDAASIATELHAMRSNMWLLRAQERNENGRASPQ